MNRKIPIGSFLGGEIEPGTFHKSDLNILNDRNSVNAESADETEQQDAAGDKEVTEPGDNDDGSATSESSIEPTPNDQE